MDYIILGISKLTVTWLVPCRLVSEICHLCIILSTRAYPAHQPGDTILGHGLLVYFTPIWASGVPAHVLSSTHSESSLVCIGITIYTACVPTTAGPFPQTAFSVVHKSLFINDSSSQQILTDCQSCAQDRYQEYGGESDNIRNSKEPTFCITVSFMAPTFISLLSPKM